MEIVNYLPENLKYRTTKDNFEEKELWRIGKNPNLSYHQRVFDKGKKRKVCSKEIFNKKEIISLEERNPSQIPNPQKKFKAEYCENESALQDSVDYYEKILLSLKEELKTDSKDIFALNALQESENKEVELCCHSVSSRCLEILLIECQDVSVMQRFMSAFAKNKIPVFTSANASHITEVLLCYALKSVKNWSTGLNAEESEGKNLLIFFLNWILDLGNFVLENLSDCLQNTYSCHVTGTLIRALAGDLSRPMEFMSKDSKYHKQQFHSQYIEVDSFKAPTSPIVLDETPKFFTKMLKKLYKSLTGLENLFDLVSESSSATVIEALLFALKRKHPKSCKKMICKVTEMLFVQKDQQGVPLALLHKNCSFVVDVIFKTADDDSQLLLWNRFIVEYLERLVTHSVGNYVVQRVFDVIQSKAVFETICETIWCFFEDILKSRNFGVFVSISAACNRLSAQQAPFMKHIMKCLHCYEPEQHQMLVLQLLLGFETYENYLDTSKSSNPNLRICLQGSLVAQAVLKFHKPIKVVQSIVNMKPSDIEFLAGHVQSCHVLHAFFESKSVGEKNKEKLLNNMKTVIVSIACDRNKSLTLSRIWVLLSLKLKEIIAKQLAQNKEAIGKSSSGFVILKKFSIHHFKRLEEWREIQANVLSNKNSWKR